MELNMRVLHSESAPFIETSKPRNSELCTATSYSSRHPRMRQNCSTLPPASLSGEGLEGRVAAVSARSY